MKYYDFIIVGSGLAGLYAAHEAAKRGRSVALLTKTCLTESNSYYAQGGIAAVTDQDDAPSYHFDDTIIAGRGLCDYPAVNILVNEGPARIKELIDEGMRFDMQNGGLALGLEGGHHRHRILHAGGDATGRMVSLFMIEKVKNNPQIDIYENHSIIGLLTEFKHCFGVRAWNEISCSEELFFGTNTFLTMGGTSALYKRTTNPQTTIGDGLALAYNAGCEICDMEFIQFHPSAIYTKGEEAFLVSEAVRGEGAHLLNHKGERFMESIHELAELAPRDIVAQSIFREMQKSGEEHVWLSLKHLPPTLIMHRFPTIYAKCKELGFDMCDKIPVAPAAHYTVGGVRTDCDGRTNIDNLFVCGELASTGIMGANRLASNSLIECLVFGKRAVEAACQNVAPFELPEYAPEYTINKERSKEYSILKSTISKLMTEVAGIIRTENGLKAGLEVLEMLKKHFTDEKEYYNLMSMNLICVAELIMTGALNRKESRGGHYREDFPESNDRYLCHTIQQKGYPLREIAIDRTEEDKKSMFENQLIEKLIDLAIEEDIATGDVTTESIIPAQRRAVAELKMKADGVISGLDVAKRVYDRFESDIIWTPYVKDGDHVKKGDIILRIEASYRTLLLGERLSLNILQRMGGIATETWKYVKELEGYNTQLLDTRKTAPGLRVLDKLAVKQGGGTNHRMGLFDMSMIKDNHIKAAGGITAAVQAVRAKIPASIKIEVETTNLDEVREALAAKADIIMLDNMNNAEMTEAVKIINGAAKTEASGNMSIPRLKEVAACGVDFISVGALTHSVTALDISMNFID
ncbi:MAG: L-aspartate oxidase [Marinifilaceae bacterium]|nr:L-aspartate oxidase [Marinifilaceae bacterium]